MISDFSFCRKPLLNFPKKTKNPTPSPIGNKFGLFLSGRSGETRTRGLLLPKQARYQLRNTPASGGTAAPPEYSISFFVRFVNTESAADGAARSAFFQPAEAAAGNSRKGHDDRRLLRELGVALAQLPKREHKNYTECKTCCALVASKPERCYHNTISPGSAAVGN